MNVLLHGVDIVELETFKELIRVGGSDFEDRCFTAIERKNADAREMREQFLAGCFAAKEATVKALLTGFDGKISPLDIEVIQTPSGEPLLTLHRNAADRAQELGASSWVLSKSDDGGFVVASVIGFGG